MDDESNRPTVRVGAINTKNEGEDAERDDHDEGVDQKASTAMYNIADGKLAGAVHSAHTTEMPVAGSTKKVDPSDRTEMMSRDQLLKNAELDRDELRHRKSTVRLDAPLPKTRPEQVAPEEQKKKTIRVGRIDDSTIEVKKVESPDDTVESTDEFARHGISMVDDGDHKSEFPVRVEEGMRLPVPVTLARELGLQPGDLLMVKIHKVDE